MGTPDKKSKDKKNMKDGSGTDNKKDGAKKNPTKSPQKK